MTKAPADAAALASYQATTQGLRDALVNFLTALWRSLGVYRNAEMATFVAHAVPVVLGAQQQMSYLTAAHLGGAVPDPRLVTGAAVRNGTPPDQVYERPFHLVWRQLAEQPHEPGAVDAAIQSGLDRAVQSALTDVQLAKTHTARVVFAADPKVVGYRRVLEGAYSCALCVVASTVRYHKGDLLPIHPACVVGGTLVAAPSSDGSQPRQLTPIEAATRRWYEGEGVVLRTSAGDLLTVTPNHPVLTPDGWIPAGLLRQGDQVVRSTRGDRVVGRVPHEHERPARVEDRFRALAVQSLVCVPLAAEDFHGDGPEGHVGVVPADRLLRDGIFASLAQHGRKQTLTVGVESSTALAGLSDPLSFLLRGDTPTSGIMRGRSLSTALSGSHSAGALQASGRTATDLMTCPRHGSGEGLTADAVLGRDGERGLTVDIAGDRLRRNDRPGTKFDAPAAQFGGESHVLHAERGRRLLDRLAGQVELDRLVFVGRVDLATHVYNLQTTEGWYSANAVIVSNCDCAVAPIVGNRDPGVAVDDQQLAAAHKAIADQFGRSSAAARAIPGSGGKSYRDVLIVHQHGELGPVLAVRGRPFTGPSDIKS